MTACSLHGTRGVAVYSGVYQTYLMSKCEQRCLVSAGLTRASRDSVERSTDSTPSSRGIAATTPLQRVLSR